MVAVKDDVSGLGVPVAEGDDALIAEFARWCLENEFEVEFYLGG